MLRLLGEASTLQNQLAQIDEYLAGIERDAARARKEEESAAANSSGWRSRARSSPQAMARARWSSNP